MLPRFINRNTSSPIIYFSIFIIFFYIFEKIFFHYNYNLEISSRDYGNSDSESITSDDQEVFEQIGVEPGQGKSIVHHLGDKNPIILEDQEKLEIDKWLSENVSTSETEDDEDEQEQLELESSMTTTTISPLLEDDLTGEDILESLNLVNEGLREGESSTEEIDIEDYATSDEEYEGDEEDDEYENKDENDYSNYDIEIQAAMRALNNEDEDEPLQNDKSKETCQQSKHLYFLKTHKTGSSTIQNIFIRKGQEMDVNFALPISPGGHVYDYNSPIKKSMVRRSNKSTKKYKNKFSYSPNETLDFDFLINHNHFNHKGISEILPYPDTKYISIVRNPGSQLESSLDYYRNDIKSSKKTIQKIEEIANQSHPHKTLPLSGLNLLATFLSSPEEFYVPRASKYEHTVHNGQLYDFGLETDQMDDAYRDANSKTSSDTKKVVSYINEINKIFNFVMILEYFDESLVILADILCWDLQDMVYLPVNSRQLLIGGNYPNSKVANTEASRQEYSRRLKIVQNSATNSWNKFDNMLYQYFNYTFWEKHVNNYGYEKLQNDVEILRAYNQQIKDTCLDPTFPNKTITNWAKIAMNRWNVRKSNDIPDICKNLAKTEQNYLRELVNEQMVV